MMTKKTFLFACAFVPLFALGCAKKFTQNQCVVQTCEEVQKNCGKIVDNCGSITDCGGCQAGLTCGAMGPNVCGTGTCTPATCASAGYSCGLLADGCGAILDCGSCDGVGTGGTTGTGGAIIGSGGDVIGTGGVVGTGGVATGGGGGIVVETCDYGTSAAAGAPGFGSPSMSGSGSTSEQYADNAVYRSGTEYHMMTNWWGGGGSSRSVSWNGTSLTVTMAGSVAGGAPAGYPTVFCGKYSDKSSGSGCGLPHAASGSIVTGAKWTSNGANGGYNVSFDIWLGDGNNLQSYLMLWMRDPPKNRPAGALKKQCVTVDGVPGVWNIWAGQVNGKPIVNYVRPEGKDVPEVEFDAVKLYQDAMSRSAELGTTLVGTQINSIAIGLEIWSDTANVKIDDFYVDVN